MSGLLVLLLLVIVVAILLRVNNPPALTPSMGYGSPIVLCIIADSVQALSAAAVGFMEAVEIPGRVTLCYKCPQDPTDAIRARLMNNGVFPAAHAASLEITATYAPNKATVVLYRNRSNLTTPPRPTQRWDTLLLEDLQRAGTNAVLSASPLRYPSFPRIQNDMIEWRPFARPPTVPQPALVLSTVGFVASKNVFMADHVGAMLEDQEQSMRLSDFSFSAKLVAVGMQLVVSGRLSCEASMYDCDLTTSNEDDTNYKDTLTRSRTAYLGLSSKASSLEARFKLGSEKQQLRELEQVA
jgi:hypothetical protein